VWCPSCPPRHPRPPSRIPKGWSVGSSHAQWHESGPIANEGFGVANIWTDGEDHAHIYITVGRTPTSWGDPNGNLDGQCLRENAFTFISTSDVRPLHGWMEYVRHTRARRIHLRSRRQSLVRGDITARFRINTSKTGRNEAHCNYVTMCLSRD